MKINKQNEPDFMDLARLGEEDRMGFIRKVYGILSTQLCITAGAVTAVKVNPELDETFRSPMVNGIAIGLLVISIFLQCTLMCCKHIARKTPTNYILLFAFTGCFTFAVCAITAFYPASDVLVAAAMTAGVTVALTIYACTTKTDFTMCGGLFFILGAVLMIIVIFSWIMTFSEFWHPIVAGILCIIYGLYLIYDTQLIVGKGQHKLSKDDYIIGALMIYVDIVMMFIELLKIFGSRR